MEVDYIAEDGSLKRVEVKGNSFVRNTVVVARDDAEPLFNVEGGLVMARLDGYVVFPKERLCDMEFIARLAAEHGVGLS